MSFLEPIYEEIRELGERGLVVKKNGEKIYSDKVYLMANQHGCRMCDVLDSNCGGAMYFPSVGQMRTKDGLINGRPDLHIPGVSPLITSMPTFTGPYFFGMDEMHMIALGIGKLTHRMLNLPKSHVFRGPSGYAFQLVRYLSNASIMTRIFNNIRLSKKTIPPSFEGCWDGNFTSYTRAVDWQNFLSSVVPCTLWREDWCLTTDICGFATDFENLTNHIRCVFRLQN
ncbi:hypothetical protein G6F56_011995 [Rhizopus delemar]|nr:hypothetical protein G6F56_011995 [Rhizopus delemar]